MAQGRKEGVQSLDRAAAVLRCLAMGGGAGRRLSDVMAKTGLGKATTHRLLRSLIRIGFVQQEPSTRLYSLGLEIFTLGAAAANRFDVAEHARPAMRRLAEFSGDTVYLSVRHGAQALCLDRQVGEFPIRTLTLNVGDRRPLGVGAGSLALLAFLPNEEIDRVMGAVVPDLALYPGFDEALVRRLVHDARAAGHAFNDGRLVSGMSAIGVPIINQRREVVAALSIAAITSRMGDDRRAELVDAVRKEVVVLEETVSPLSQRSVADRAG